MKYISKACKSLLIEEPFYGYFLLNLNKKYSDTLPTAGVYNEGINTALAINQEFWMNLTEDQRVGILKHEVLHICFFHLSLRNNFGDAQLFNIAADIEVNQYIKNEYLPEGALRLDSFKTIQLEKFKGTSYYYEKLQQNLQKPKKKGKKGKEGKGSGEGDSERTPQNGKGGQNQQGGGNSKYRDEDLDRMMQKPIHKSWEWFNSLSEAEKKLIKNQIEHSLKETAKQTKKSVGSVPSEMQRLVNELLSPKEQVFNWKAYFRRFLGVSQEIYTRKTRRKLSKRFSGNPGLKIKQKKHILFAVDTSGSMAVKELNEAFSEVRYVQKAGASVTIVECDAAIGAIYKYDGKFRGKVTGGGGTSFDPVIEYYNANKHLYTTLIYFTDGYAAKPIKPHKEVMWVISSNGRKDYSELPGYVIQIPKT